MGVSGYTNTLSGPEREQICLFATNSHSSQDEQYFKSGAEVLMHSNEGVELLRPSKRIFYRIFACIKKVDRIWGSFEGLQDGA
jgi:hypothetical protein